MDLVKRLEKIIGRPALVSRFESKFTRRDNNLCWIWHGALRTCGYGYIQIQNDPISGKPISALAHRISWYLANGNISDSVCVLHRCDNRKCVNPNHLFLGTRADNVWDCIRKGRRRYHVGVNHHRSVVSESQVKYIRKQWNEGLSGCMQLARKFGVTKGCIHGIVYRLSWKHI